MLELKGLDEGLKEGVDEGLKEGLHEGLKEGVDEGLKEGLAVGVSSTVDEELDVHWASVLYPSPEAMDCNCVLK